MSFAVALLALLLATGAGAPPAATAPASTRVLLAKLRAAGRAEVGVRVERRDPLGGGARVARGRLALELPRFARLDLDDGQRLTLRDDGGDWLQPATRQLIRAGARTTSGLLLWCGALLDPRTPGLVERKIGAREYALVPRAPAVGDTQRVTLGGDGLPLRVVVTSSPGESVEYRLSGWRFGPARGRSGFVLEPPRGYEVVKMQ